MVAIHQYQRLPFLFTQNLQ